MSTTTDSVKARIRKLLQLAENDAATDGEISNAIAFAQRLMAEHHLSEEQVKEGDPVNLHAVQADLEKLTMLRLAAFGQGEKLASWEVTLSMFVSKLVGGVGVYGSGARTVRTATGTIMFDSRGRSMVRSTVTFYGADEDVRLAQQLYVDIATTIAAMARLKFGGAFRGEGRSYGDGFVAGLQTKLREATAASAAESKSLAIRCDAIVKAKVEHANKWLKQQGVTLSSRGHGSGSFHPSAFSAGKQDGLAADISAKRTTKLAAGAALKALPAGGAT